MAHFIPIPRPASRHCGAGLVLAALAACAPADFAGDPFAGDGTGGAYPLILPLDPLLANVRALPDPADPDPELRRRGEALRARAARTADQAGAARPDARPQNTGGLTAGEPDPDRDAALRDRAARIRAGTP